MELKYKNLYYRKLKITDYRVFRKLFYSCFKRRISFDFYKWRYFSNKFSFCYGVFSSSKLIANVGMVSLKLNNKSNERIFSRHSSMVLKKYRGIGLFSELLNKVKKKISNKISLILMWPNQNNLASFGIEKKNILQKKFYIYKIVSNLNYNKNIKNYSINELTKYKKYFQKNNSFLLKNFTYFKNRYLSYKKHEYVINKFEYKNSISFIVLKKNKDKSGTNFVILDHFGSKEIYQRHLSFLINNQNKLIFLSKKLLKKNNCLLMSKLNLKIGVIKKLNIKKKNFLKNKNIFLGDTDTFISI
jgi:hypothetical protein